MGGALPLVWFVWGGANAQLRHAAVSEPPSARPGGALVSLALPGGQPIICPVLIPCLPARLPACLPACSAGTYDFGSKAVMVMQTAVVETAGWEQAALGAQQQPQQPLQPQAQQQQLLQQAQQRLLEQQRLLQQQQLQPPGGSGFGM